MGSPIMIRPTSTAKIAAVIIDGKPLLKMP